jgi:guanine deaminase
MIVEGRLLLDPNVPPAPGWLAVDGARIADVGSGPPPAHPDIGDADCIVCPGFVDAHTHLPQFDAIGCDGMDLLDWLQHTIFPAEMRWADAAEAERQAERGLRRMLRAGTTACAAFLTSHPHGVAAACRAAESVPLRVRAGQAIMDRHAPPALLGHDAAPLITGADGRFTTSVNPRFAVTCTADLLAEAGRRAAAEQAWVQTHLAESARECAAVADLFPEAPSYTALYDAHGLVHERSLLAHCLHLDEDEWRLLAERRAVAVHCPTANAFLEAGVFDLAAARRHGVRVALGSDVAAGSDAAMPRIGRAMIDTAKIRRLTVDPDAAVPTPAEAWTMITRGNADALGFADAGRLEAGCGADFLVLRAGVEPDEHLAGRLLYAWDDDFIVHRVLAGRLH